MKKSVGFIGILVGIIFSRFWQYLMRNSDINPFLLWLLGFAIIILVFVGLVYWDKKKKD